MIYRATYERPILGLESKDFTCILACINWSQYVIDTFGITVTVSQRRNNGELR